MLHCKHDNNIIISFKYSVRSKDHNIEKITKKSKEKCNDKIYELYKKLEELSNMKVVDFQNKPKGIGYEMIPISNFDMNIDDNIKKELELTNDSKIIVFRFNNQKCRLFIVQSRKCESLLYIIGYDWDYSAYKH